MIKEKLNQSIIEDASDRRLDSRVNVEIPVQVEFDSGGQLGQITAIASQLSKRGVAVFSDQSLPANTNILLRIPLDDSGLPVQPTARVAWSSSRNGKTMHGIQFLHVPIIHQPFLNRFLINHLNSRHHVQERRVRKTKIISELIEFRNRLGKRIIGFHDHLLTTDLTSPFLVIPSPYGETKSNSIHIAYFLANNGFNVIRFDPTDHVGESEGEHLDYTFPKLKGDILSALDYVQSKSPRARIGIVAASLAARAAYKVVSEDFRPSLLISLAGVVNTQYTLNMVQNVDLIGTHLKGKVWGTINVAGFNVKADQFLSECVKTSFHNLESTISDLRKAHCPIVFLWARKDPWVDPIETKKVVKSLPSSRIDVHYMAAMHRLKENPTEAKNAFRLIVDSASKYMNRNYLPQTVRDPGLREIGVEARLERERSRYLNSFTKEEENEFWAGYLRQFHYISSVADYRDLLETVYSELGIFRNNDAMLDAGCGNGNLGLWVLAKMADECERSGGKKKVVFHYIGIDIVNEALSAARKYLKEGQSSFRKKLGLSRDFMVSQFQHVDMNQSLPFLTDSFDKICSNLVISYLENPVFALRELIRVLKPGGKLVITTLKKEADVSQIYRNFIEKASSEDEIEEARNLLSNAGKIILKESEGYFRFFAAEELQTILKQAYPNCFAQFHPCFSNQAILLTVTK